MGKTGRKPDIQLREIRAVWLRAQRAAGELESAIKIFHGLKWPGDGKPIETPGIWNLEQGILLLEKGAKAIKEAAQAELDDVISREGDPPADKKRVV